MKLIECLFQDSAISLTLVESEDYLELLIEKSISTVPQKMFDFTKKHPLVSSLMLYYAFDAVKKYQDAKKQSVRLFSKDSKDRSHYKEMIKSMQKNGYKILRHGSVGLYGYEWIVKK